MKTDLSVFMPAKSKKINDIFGAIDSLKDSYQEIFYQELSKIEWEFKELRGDRRKNPQIEISKVKKIKASIDKMKRIMNKIETCIKNIKENKDKNRVIEKNILEIATYMKEKKPSIKTVQVIKKKLGMDLVIGHIGIFHKLNESMLYDILEHPSITNNVEFLRKNISVFERLGWWVAMMCLSYKQKDILLDNIDHFDILWDDVVRGLIYEGEIRFIAENKDHFSYESEHSKHIRLLIHMEIEKIENEKRDKENIPQWTIKEVKDPLQEKIEEMLKYGLWEGVIEMFLGKKWINNYIVIKTIWEQDPDVFKRNIQKIPPLDSKIAKFMIKNDPEYVRDNLQIFKKKERSDILMLCNKEIQERREKKWNKSSIATAKNYIKYEEYDNISLRWLQGKEVSKILNTLIEKKQFTIVERELPMVKNISFSVALHLLKGFRIDILAKNITSFEILPREFANEFRGEHYNIATMKKEDFSRVVEEYPEKFGIS